MGPETNNSLNNTIGYKLSSEQLGLISNSNDLTKKNNKKRIITSIIGILVAIFLIVLVLIMFFSQKKIGSGDIKDLTAFVKLYQYGDENEKKDVNLNLPANYTYAYKMLSGSATSVEKSEYAARLTSQYLKYSNQGPINSFLMLFGNYLEFTEKIAKIRSSYSHDEQSANELVNKYISQIKKTNIAYVNDNLSYISEYYNKYTGYLQLVKKAGCIKNQEIDNNCEVDTRRNFTEHEDLYDTYMELYGLEKEIYDSFMNSTVYLDNAIITLYKTKAIVKKDKK